MLEYASIRLMLVWTTPTTVPRIMVAAAMTDEHWNPLRLQRLERRQEHANECGERRRLHAGRHERRDDRRRALVGVWRPHVERHCRDLEREPDDEAARRQQGHRRMAHERPATTAPRRAGRAASSRRPRKRTPRRRGRTRSRTAQQKVLERRLGAGRAGAADARQHVDRQATTLRARGR